MPIYVSLGVSFVFILLPTDSISASIFKAKKSIGFKLPYKEAQAYYNTDYDIANPVYNQKNKKKKNTHFLKNVGDMANLFNYLSNAGGITS